MHKLVLTVGPADARKHYPFVLGGRRLVNRRAIRAVSVTLPWEYSSAAPRRITKRPNRPPLHALIGGELCIPLHLQR